MLSRDFAKPLRFCEITMAENEIALRQNETAARRNAVSLYIKGRATALAFILTD